MHSNKTCTYIKQINTYKQIQIHTYIQIQYVFYMYNCINTYKIKNYMYFSAVLCSMALFHDRLLAKNTTVLLEVAENGNRKMTRYFFL